MEITVIIPVYNREKLLPRTLASVVAQTYRPLHVVLVDNGSTDRSLAVLQDKPQFHISFIMNVSPECDCWNHNDAAIVPDLGMAASLDPVALDMACADLVMNDYLI